MKVIEYRGKGDEGVIAVGARPTPPPGELEVGMARVRVEAVGLNRADLLQRKGQYPAPAGYPPDIPGLEFAGVIDALGPVGADNLPRLAVGDRVLAITGGGAMAEHVVIAQAELIAVPAGMSAAAAASIPEAFITAWDAIIVQGRMRRGDAVLIHAAASGVGLAAVAIVEAFGGHAVATTRSAAKAEAVRRYAPGAHVVVVQDNASFAAEVMAVAPQGVAVVLDCVGAAYFDDNVSVLAPGGRWLLIGFLGGSRKEISLVPLLMKKLSLIGSTLRSRGPAERAATAEAFAREVMPRIASGAIALPPVTIRPIDELAAAQAEMERNLTVGKTVLTMWQP